jgi:hypothetical protein
MASSCFVGNVEMFSHLTLAAVYLSLGNTRVTYICIYATASAFGKAENFEHKVLKSRL